MYTDDTLITFGKHKFTSLGRVPAIYLLELYKQKSKIKDSGLVKYLEDNFQTIQERAEGKLPCPPLSIGYKVSGKRVNLVCKDSNKIIFISEKEAKSEIKRIQNLQQESKKPVRSYECEKCGGWHLTSIPFEKWEKHNK